MFNLDLSANVPLYGQQVCFWCGAASGEMARNGYPNPADRLFYLQSDVWNTIQVYNSTNPADAGWATDPHGLMGALMNLSNPAGVHWVEFSDPSRDAVLHFMLYWMSVRKFPSPVLVNQGGHWVVVVGYQSDIQPQPGNTITLQQIVFHDPEPHNIGTITTMSASQWYGGPWNGAVIYSGTWLNKYVAVVEPPLVKGTVKVAQVERTGKKVISPEESIRFARGAIEELKLADQPQHTLLARESVTPFEPMLVRDSPAQNRHRSAEDPHYYVVPFGVRNELERNERLARAVVLVNAYTGAFEEATVFGRPVRFLTRDAALAVAAKAAGIDIEKLKDASATLMFQPSKVSHIRAFPFWEIKFADKTLFLDQLGEVYGRLELSIPGD